MKRLSDPPFEQLLTQTRMTNCLLAAQLRQHMSQQDIVGLLRGVGASGGEIAQILGASYATVAVSISRIRKSREQKELLNGEAQEDRPPEADLCKEGR